MQPIPETDLLPSEVTLYGTSCCHLCEQALDLILPVSAALGLPLAEIDIADDPLLTEIYGIRIPVLAYAGGELGWPFDQAQIIAFLSRKKD